MNVKTVKIADVKLVVRTRFLAELTISALFRHLIFSLAFCLLPITFSARAAQLEEIQQRGYLIVAVKDNLRPLGFRDDKGNLQGLEIDLARRLAVELLGREDAVRWKPVANSDRLTVVLQGKVDLTIARVTATATRDRIVSFSIPYYMDGITLVTKDTSIQKLGDVEQRTIAVLNGSSTIAKVRYALPKAELVGVNSYQAAKSLLDSGGAAAFAADASVLTGWVQEYPQYRLLPSLLSAEPLCVVMPKGVQYDDLRRRVNSAIARLKAEGWLQQRAIYWGLPGDNLKQTSTRFRLRSLDRNPSLPCCLLPIACCLFSRQTQSKNLHLPG